MNYFQILILALIQGLCELLPVSSSAHVIVAEKLMGLDPSAPQMTLLLVMLHTGTMFAVIVYFWKGWQRDYFFSLQGLWKFSRQLFLATLCTGVVGLTLKMIIEKIFMAPMAHAEIENLFSNLPLIATALASVGLLMIVAGTREKKSIFDAEIKTSQSFWIGVIQGICLPFRGFSRSGSTISIGLLLGISKQKIEEFSFALAVLLTPAVIAKELWRLIKHHQLSGDGLLAPLFTQCFVGMLLSFLAGMIALKWLSCWLQGGRWKIFGFYCIIAAMTIMAMVKLGFL
ncbi:MAG: undecaprenyl-diphosphate phosphatase [Chthoniobacterales bacterium]